MSRGPGRWQRLILDDVEQLQDGHIIALSDYYNGIGAYRPPTWRESMRRAVRTLSAHGRIATWRMPGTGTVIAKPSTNRDTAKYYPPQLATFSDRARFCLDECIDTGKPFTVDTVRMKMGSDVQDVDENTLPAVFSRYAQDGKIVRIGSVRSSNRSRNGGWNALWIKA